ncbi:MAG: hypothetical protein V7636_1057 [Actinomycetota bacterium]
MSLKSSPRSHRIASMWVVALLAANGAVLATGMAEVASHVVAQAPARLITLITNPDGTQVAVDPNTPEGWKAIDEAKRNGAQIANVEVPDDAVAASKGSGGNPLVTIPGINAGDLQSLLSGTVDHIVTTVKTIIDDTGKTVISVVDGTVSTVSSIVDDAASTASSVVNGAQTTVSSVVGGAQTTVSSVVGSVPTTIPGVPTTIPVATTIPTVPTTIPVVTVPTTIPVVTTIQSPPTTIPVVTTIQNTVTTIQNTVTTLLGGLGGGLGH